ncbi:MAG: enoyl-CoA hydratase [Rhodobacteraceae bacterium]|nr:enoyl-CoA hydratase [Paracoccaceae bacterium]
MAILERNDKGAVAHLVMNAPERLNALSDEMLAALMAEFDALAADNTIRVVILSGTGRAFCAGHDLKQMTAGRLGDDAGRAYFADLFVRCTALMARIQSLPQVVIARVHGLATAAGCQLVATCDLAVADSNTRFGVNGVNIGLFCSTPMVALSRNIPRKQAFEMLTTGAFITAPRAEALGLINRVVAPDALADQTQALAEVIAAKLGSAVKTGKRAFYEQLQMPVTEAYAFTGDVMVQNMLDPDTVEGIAAFIAKRDPTWTQ